jgi:Ca2+-binding RTX toxin-like protein
MSSTVTPAAFAFLFGLGRNDVICASGAPFNNTGQTVIEGGAGSDTITGFPFTLTINQMFVQGGPGCDTILGSLLNDTLDGGPGPDVINGMTGNDTLTGAGGNDTITGGFNNDFVNAGGGDDTIFVGGDLAVDSVICGPGADNVGLIGPPGSADGFDVLDPTSCFP